MKLNRLLIVLAAALLIGINAFGQGTTGDLTGTVTSGGSPVPGVTVTASSPSLQGVRTTNTDVNGNYTIGALPPGDYTVKFDLSGMQSVSKRTRVALAQTARADADLKISGITEAITVTAQSPVTAALESTEVQTNVQQATVNELPMVRDLVNVAGLAPGVTTGSTTTLNNGTQMVISGAPSADNLYLVNGAVVNENIRSQVHNLFIEDAIQETTVQTAGISAEYGRFTGGVVNMITKSGGNQVTASVRDNLENQKWTAMTKYPSEPAHLDKINPYYEATLGGPIMRDRLWFFLAGRYRKTSTSTSFFSLAGEPTAPYTRGQTNKRYEGKLTAQIAPNHNLTASYMTNNVTDTNYCFFNCAEPANIDPSRNLPNNFLTAQYNGVITQKLMVEVGYSKKYFAFKNSGGDFPDFVHGTWGYDLNTGAFFGAPVFCGFCSPELRNNHDVSAKTTYYLATQSLGTHTLVAGVDDFVESRKANNYQSGSNFEVYTFNTPDRAADGTVMPIITAGDYIQWTPIFALSRGSDLNTKSAFVNDKWDLSKNFNFNIGLRYDKNHVIDSAGHETANDSKVSPRLGIVYDVMGNGHLRLNANYGTYVAHIQEAIGGSGASGAGNPAYIDYEYTGPDITGLPTIQAFQQLYDWFQGQGGTNAKDLIFAASYPGVSTIITTPVKSPSVNEYTLGAGAQLGANAYVRGDLIDRNYKNYYGLFTNVSTGQVADPAGNLSDLGIIQNSSNLKRKYRAAILQANYRVTQNINVGGNYTYSKTQGNFIAETGGNGPVTDLSTQYPEFKAFAQNHPYGYLAEDQRNKARLFATYELHTAFGGFAFGLLQRYDSGTPYSAFGSIRIQPYVDQSLLTKYQNPPTTVTYYFSDRGHYRWDNVSATDLSLTYTLPVPRINIWVKGDVVNAFDQQAQINGNTSVRTATTSLCKQTVGANVGARCAAFNPFTDTPQLGVNYQFGPVFGQARGASDYQLARTYRVAVGVRY